MRSNIVPVATALLAAAVLGCSPEKELPDAGKVTHGPDAETGEASPKVPAVSDPKARAVVDRAVQIIAQNHPERLKKAEVSAARTSGKIRLPTASDLTTSERTVDAVWPDRIRVEYKFKDLAVNQTPSQTWGLHSPVGWSTSFVPNSTPTSLAQYIQINMQAEHWFPLGLGLADPNTICFDPQPEKALTGAALQTVRVKMTDRSVVYTMAFEESSGLLVYIDYSPIEMGQRASVHKKVTFSDHADAGGLKLPGKMRTYLNDQLGEEWTIDAWEFPEKLDNALFDPPQPKK